MFSKLNGWQRLWVVVSVILFIVSAFFAYYNILHDKVNDAKCVAEFNVRWSQSHPQNNLPPGLTPIPDVFDLAADPVYMVCEKWEKVKFVLRVFLIWLATIAFIYAAGFSVAWVRKGFRAHRTS